MDQTIDIKKTARYSTYGNPETADTVWVVLHGYGQLTPYFIRKFHSLDPDNNFVIAPEGLHRFYLNGTSGRVGASWMTKEEREQDISDNINYLNDLKTNVIDQHVFNKKILLGFSQGGATACRWHEQGNFKADYFVLWASVFPPDLDISLASSIFHESNNYFVVGSKDEYYNSENRNLLIQSLKDKQLHFNTKIFDGAHTIDDTTLIQIKREVNNRE